MSRPKRPFYDRTYMLLPSFVFLNALGAYSLLWFFSVSTNVKAVTNPQERWPPVTAAPPWKRQCRGKTLVLAQTGQLGQLHLKGVSGNSSSFHTSAHIDMTGRYSMLRRVGGQWSIITGALWQQMRADSTGCSTDWRTRKNRRAQLSLVALMNQLLPS